MEERRRLTIWKNGGWRNRRAQRNKSGVLKGIQNASRVRESESPRVERSLERRGWRGKKTRRGREEMGKLPIGKCPIDGREVGAEMDESIGMEGIVGEIDG